MSTELQRSERTDIAPISFTDEQVSLIKGQLMRGASDGELSMFMATCTRLQLDPFARQIYAIKRKDRGTETWTIQTGIDGFRVVASRYPSYEGQTAPQWCGPDMVWRDVWLDAQPPAAARVGVWRTGFREPCWGVARYASYCQRYADGNPVSPMWKTMPEVMLAKCAEAQGLRKAFPNDLSGIYTTDERPIIDLEESAPGVYKAPEKPSPNEPAPTPQRAPSSRPGPRYTPTGAVVDVEAEPTAPNAVVLEWAKKIGEATTLEQLEAMRPELRKIQGQGRTVLIHAYNAQETYLREPPAEREPGEEG